jgi:hypothetical protein
MARMIEEVKADLTTAYSELETLKTELEAIKSTLTVTLDMSKSLDVFTQVAQKLYVDNKNIYKNELETKNQQIKQKRSQINILHEEAKRILFDTNTVQYTEASQ